ncbi:MAG: hypothetical protein P4L85_17645 [Paludisphaera borealis]|uniref:hypothetical protein n=1 Tax=Paludisphaera borealis TaxID=1387353 RepID=UPI0028519662|nr:hypothetical protein [Paludisphaera borealis]MDR3621180.1 hypothetical protein [Paludisphaera borealis]
MTELYRHIHTNVLPNNASVPWNFLRVELWSDSGRIIVYPASTSTPNRIEKAGCQVIFSDLLLEYDRLADSGLDDDVFVAALEREEEKWVEGFLDAARRAGPFGIRIQCWSSGEQLIRDEQI